MSEEPCQSINILALGNSQVGKSTYFVRIVKNKFEKINLTTIGYNILIKRIELKNGKKVN